MLFIRRKKNLKIKKSKNIFIQEKFFDIEILFSSLKNVKMVMRIELYQYGTMCHKNKAFLKKVLE
ncbi:hypothetical protein BpHYR1_018453 [Brachionus plicatilis]|uniref:Uncharacterized protein n=1 Tax=Brachionus plicatilis TaxID=10195 RepID=A0A3M7PPU5_BRAPC|nr:hypothetical protein BpHYR1_018453 [Brachionus plicatilis]